MSPVLSTLRHDQLRDVLLSTRASRLALKMRDLATAFRYYDSAARGLAFAKALFIGHGVSATATATLAALLRRLEGEIEAALAPVPRVEARELVPAIAAALEVLRTRDGVDIDDDQIVERARGIASVLTADYEFVAVH